MELRIQNVLNAYKQFEAGYSNELYGNVRNMILQLYPFENRQFRTCHIRKDGEQWTAHLQVVERLLIMGKAFGLLNYLEPLAATSVVDFHMIETYQTLVSGVKSLDEQLMISFNMGAEAAQGNVPRILQTFDASIVNCIPICTAKNFRLLGGESSKNYYVFIGWLQREIMKAYTRKMLLQDPYDVCCNCKVETSYRKSLHVNLRKNYVDGMGQHCEKCAKE